MSISELQQRVKSLEDSVKQLKKLHVSKTITKTNSKTNSKTKTSKKTSKKKQNPYFSAMLKAKKSGAPSFIYGDKTYIRKEHPQLGYIYKQK